MKLKHENESGLHQKYVIRKLVPKEFTASNLTEYGKRRSVSGIRYVENDVDEGSEYFVMRLDEGGSDIEHIKACRIGVHAYADAIEHRIPQLAKELREHYPLLP